MGHALHMDDDRQLVAFEVLVREHHRALLAYARALVEDDDAAEDIVQEAFVIAFRRMSDFDPSRDFAAWMRGIVRFTVRDWQRARRRRPQDAGVVRDIERLHELCDRAEAGAGCDRLEALRRCLERLSGLLRATVERFHIAGRSYGEIAAETGTSEAVVRKRMQRARELLLGCIQATLAGARR